MENNEMMQLSNPGWEEKQYNTEALAVLFGKHEETIRRWNRKGYLVAKPEKGKNGENVYTAAAVRDCARKVNEWTPELEKELGAAPASQEQENENAKTAAVAAVAGVAAMGVGIGAGVIGLGVVGAKRLHKYLSERREKLSQEVRKQPDKETLLRQRQKLQEQLQEIEKQLREQEELEEVEAIERMLMDMPSENEE